VTLVPVISSPLSRIASELQKPPSPGIELRTVLGDCGLCSCNLLFETNNFAPGAVLLSYLVSEIQEPPSPGIEIRTLSFGVLTLLCSLPSLKKQACQVWGKSVYPFSSYKRTYIQRHLHIIIRKVFSHYCILLCWEARNCFVFFRRAFMFCITLYKPLVIEELLSVEGK
jgi:hypothetical protein